MEDKDGNTYRCPRCNSYLILENGKDFHCHTCGYLDKPENFPAVPREKLYKYWNPSRR